MIKKLTVVLLLIATLSMTTFAQFGFPPHSPTILRLSDETQSSHIMLVREDGVYLLIGDGIRVEGEGRLLRRGCGMVLEDVQPTYRLVVAGNSCNGTGKAVLHYFGLGTFTIFDRTRNGEE